MNRLRLRDVLAATGAVLVRGGDEDVTLIGVSTDTRTLGAGELFVALDGPSFDGNRFAAAAAGAGATALLLREGGALDVDALPANVAVAVHPNPRRALADIGAWYRSTLACSVVGITGSCGKTTTKNILRDLLAQSYPVVASPSSFNNDIGVPHTIFLADEKTSVLAIEMGTNHPGEIATLCRIARPTGGIITNVGASHLEGLGSIDGVAREKGDLAASLPRDGFCVLNADCRFTPTISARTAARVITFSIEGGIENGALSGAAAQRADLDASDLYFHASGTTFRLRGADVPGGEQGAEVTSPLLGTHNVQNLLAALAACLGLGISLEDVLPRIGQLSGGRQRMERVQLRGLTVFDDSYNANPESLNAAVRVLAGLHGFERRVLVLGDMLELGELAAELHHEVGRNAAAAGIDRIVLVGELAKAAAAGALEGGLPKDAVVHVETTSQAIPLVEQLVRDGDVVLVKGSRRMKLEAIVQELVERRGPPVG